MGIFQLLDYVGIEVCQRICKIMSEYLPNELFQDPLIDRMVEEGIVGGQYPDGPQKDGFFQYEGPVRKGIYSFVTQGYVALNNPQLKSLTEREIGPLPKGHETGSKCSTSPTCLKSSISILLTYRARPRLELNWPCHSLPNQKKSLVI